MRNKHPRLYSLFERNGKRWKRIATQAYTRKTAVVVFQNRLINAAIGLTAKELRLRPVN